MTTDDIARSHLRSARAILREARMHADEDMWHLAVRRAQEAVELAHRLIFGD